MFFEDKVTNLGILVKQHRKNQKLTQEQLAAVSGVGTRFLRELEQGKSSCHLGKSLQVIAMLGIDIFLNGKKL